jgi:hypothetical protein
MLYREQTSEEANLMLKRQTRGTKSCTLCSLGRHTAFKYDLIGDFGTPLTKGCLQSRMALISDLMNNERFVVYQIADDDHRLALKSLPKSVSAMILHTKCQLGREVVIETTLIRHKCVDEEFSKVPFKIEAMSNYVNRQLRCALCSYSDTVLIVCTMFYGARPSTVLCRLWPTGGAHRYNVIQYR